MSDANQAQALAKAIHLVLSSDVAVQSVLGQTPRLYDHAPEDPIFPYLTYGPMRSEDIGGDDSPMAAHNLTLHLWSRYGGRAETMTLIQAVSGALENGGWQLMSGHLVSANIVFTDQFRAPDGRTIHGIIRLNATTQPISQETNMAAQRGRDMLVKIKNDQGVFVTVAGLRTKTLKLGAKSVDITHSESDEAWRELLPGAGEKSVEISGEGIFRDGASDALVRASFFDQTAKTYEIIIPDFGTIAGNFMISSLVYAGSYKGVASYELQLVSAGKPVFAAL